MKKSIVCLIAPALLWVSLPEVSFAASQTAKKSAEASNAFRLASQTPENQSHFVYILHLMLEYPFINDTSIKQLAVCRPSTLPRPMDTALSNTSLLSRFLEYRAELAKHLLDRRTPDAEANITHAKRVLLEAATNSPEFDPSILEDLRRISRNPPAADSTMAARQAITLELLKARVAGSATAGEAFDGTGSKTAVPAEAL